MTQKTSVRVAAVQMAPDLETAGGTVSKVLAAIAEAAGKGREACCFPETFVPWYPYFSFVHPPVLTGAEHIRLYDNAVVVPGPVTEAVAAAAQAPRHRGRARRQRARPRLALQRAAHLRRRRRARPQAPQDHADLPRADDLGAGRRLGLTVVDTAVGRVGALACWEHYNPLARYALMAQHEEIHVAQFPGSMVGSDFRRADRSDDPPPRAGKRLFRRQRDRLADRGADREDFAGRKAAQGAARRLHDRDRLAGRRACRAAADRRARAS